MAFSSNSGGSLPGGFSGLFGTSVGGRLSPGGNVPPSGNFNLMSALMSLLSSGNSPVPPLDNPLAPLPPTLGGGLSPGVPTPSIPPISPSPSVPIGGPILNPGIPPTVPPTPAPPPSTPLGGFPLTPGTPSTPSSPSSPTGPFYPSGGFIEGGGGGSSDNGPGGGGTDGSFGGTPFSSIGPAITEPGGIGGILKLLRRQNPMRFEDALRGMMRGR